MRGVGGPRNSRRGEHFAHSIRSFEILEAEALTLISESLLLAHAPGILAVRQAIL